ncbi:heterokaryon incompatibility protein-domain-containing protein, partial [Bisporella sp. PMI_857]
QYVTLSHCWGTSQFYKLTASTFIELTEGIEKARLPQTFQDAINVAKALGVKLIWIDSLCIFQDSAEDWFHEAPLMSEIYGGSICNIAASSSVDSAAGALAVRDISLELVRPCVFPAAWSNHEPHVLYPKSFWQDSLHHTPLIQRAWVVQEILLAPRIVYLHERQLFWECYQMRACEGFPGGIPIDSEAQTTERVLLSGIKAPVLEEFGRQIFPFERSIIPDRNFIIEMARNFWIKTIRHYNSCQLTNQKDKLIALSGVTKPLETLLDDICPAGLWAKQFVPQLLWKISPATGPIIRLTASSVPSWSWASFTG